MQKIGGGPLKPELLAKAVKMGIDRGKEIRKKYLEPLVHTS